MPVADARWDRAKVDRTASRQIADAFTYVSTETNARLAQLEELFRILENLPPC